MYSIVILILILLIYFLPSITAYSRKHKNTEAILALNFLTGWTLVGWVISLVWSLTKQEGVK